MKKLAMLGVLGAALAWNARADDAQDKKQEAKAEVQKAQAEASKEAREAKAEASKEASEAQAKAEEKVGEAKQEAAETRREAAEEGTASGGADRTSDPAASGMDDDVRRTNEAGGNAGAVNQGTGSMAYGSDKHPVFTKDNFDIEGKVQSASKDSITLRREELPPAKLSVDRNTKIELDGQKVSAQQLQPGQEVKASFNLQNDKPMAVEIKAEKKD